MLGTEKNYYVVETEFLEGEYNTDVIDDEADDVIKDSTSKHSQETDNLSKDISIFNGDDDDDDDDDDDEVPVIYRPPPKIPCEDPGFGTNLKVYFVCNEPGLPWHRLPHVTPDQIVQARQVRAYFTGNLQHVHATFPPFPGNEANYLRAQIARITSSTSVSPIGYFKFDEEGEEEEEHTEQRDACVKDEDFDGVSTRDLADPSLQYWVHHANYILPQGRTVWYNPLNARRGGRGDEGEDEEEGDEEEDRNEPDEPEPQLPQPLLVPISEDVVGGSPAWVCRMTSLYVPEHSPVALVSFRWPGAVTVATDRGKFFENLYVGYGQKELGDDFDPALPGDPRMEFPTGPEIMEQDDPTPGEEAAVKAALREQEEMIKMREGEEDEDEEDEDDEEGDEENEDDD